MKDKKKIKLIIINISIFVAIFSIFSIVTYKTIQSTQYRNIDFELLENRKNLKKISKSIEPFMIKSNPRITVIFRNNNGDILNKGPMMEYYKINERELRPNRLDEIYNITVHSDSFRTLAFLVNFSGRQITVQILTNVNSIEQMMDNLLNILIIGGIIILFVSMGASWYLAGKSMESIIESWKKQKLFVENASHELRTPLAIIHSRLEIILREPNAKIIDKYDDIEPALMETKRVSKMVSDLLTLARSDSNTIELEKKEVNLKELLDKVIQPYKELGEMEGKKVNIDIENVSLYCDEGRIQQLFIILLDNALKYTDNGEVINIRVFNKDNKCLIYVEDEGIGIKQENKEKIFERFYREDKARTRESGGSGLGLSIAKWIVEKHNGSIEIQTNIPKGTRVIIKLRIKKEYS
ncbi:sensor histidine kinase [Clostridium rectalis]|uniref:sensor histidine kinase n=1 Tax=Clostridium rectalis TaxID=2040295 RepID=UPI000F641846|nr:HAMP domain-containing sensor histidine kinase [Clostridium rectalis]